MPGLSNCHICLVLGSEPLGGWVYRDERWAAGVHPKAEVPGWIVLSLRRHAEGMDAMSGDEAASFGTVLTLLSGAITKVCRPERIYLLSFGDLYPHWHLLLAARGAAVPVAHRGPQLWTHRHRYLDPAAAQAAAEQMGQLLAEDSLPR